MHDEVFPFAVNSELVMVCVVPSPFIVSLIATTPISMKYMLERYMGRLSSLVQVETTKDEIARGTIPKLVRYFQVTCK